MTRANLFWIWRTENGFLFDRSYHCWAVPCFGLLTLIGFDELAEVHVVSKNERYVIGVATPAIARQLETSASSIAKLQQEFTRVSSLGDVVSQNELRGSFDSNERPAIANVTSFVAFTFFGLFLASNERPDFIALNVVNFNARNGSANQNDSR